MPGISYTAASKLHLTCEEAAGCLEVGQKDKQSNVQRNSFFFIFLMMVLSTVL